MKIETERLVIRDFQKRDVVGLLEYLSNPRVNCFAADRLCSEDEDTYNVGWHFNKRFEGKGLAREAVIGLLDYLFREAGARRIYGFVEDDNIRSKRLCERLGMRREGCFKEFVTFINNPNGTPKYEDTRVYSILKKEWNSISAKSITNN